MKMMHGAFCFGLREQVAHARGADADEHLDELGSAQAEERNLGFARDGARQQRLAGSRRADEQHALRNAAAERRVLLRVLQELDDLLELLLGLVHAGDIREAHLHVVFGEDAMLAARERHHAAFRAARCGGRRSSRRAKSRSSGTIQPRISGSQRLTNSPVYFTLGGVEILEQLRDPRCASC